MLERHAGFRLYRAEPTGVPAIASSIEELISARAGPPTPQPTRRKDPHVNP